MLSCQLKWYFLVVSWVLGLEVTVDVDVMFDCCDAIIQW